MSDEVDFANELALRSQEDALKLHKEFNSCKNRNQTNICEECGLVIPPRRLEIIKNAIHCVECAEIYEREEKRYVQSKIRNAYKQ